MKTIAFDIDGFLANTHLPWLWDYNKEYNDTLTIGQITQWDMSQLVKPECGKKIYSYLTPELFDRVPPFSGALDMVKEARRYANIVFATTATENTFGVKYHWLKTHGFEPTIKTYMDIGDKGLINAHALVDDYDGNFVDFKGMCVLFDRPWNRGLVIDGLTRVYSYNDVIEVIKYL